MKLLRKVLHVGRLHATVICVILFAVTFSSWLMFHTFSYNGHTHEFRIAYKLWSDFGAHIPMIRSFSLGDNIERFLHGQTSYPIFPGEPIRYHFLFFLLVGLLEKAGLRIDWALNIPSILGLTSLIVFLYVLTVRVTGSKRAGLLSVLFLVFNGSFGFLRFFSLHPVSVNTLNDIVSNKDFPAFAPWGPGEVSAFWNLNIITNQRHLAASFAIILGFILTCMHIAGKSLKKQFPWIILWSCVIGMLPYFHQPTLLILAICMATYLLCFPKLRPFIFITGTLSLLWVLPQLVTVQGSGGARIEWYPGYLIHNELAAQTGLIQNISHLASFWLLNIGLHYLLIPIGFFLLPNQYKLYFLPLIPLFIIPNLFKFSVEASANHKFFNFVLLMGSICSAQALTAFGRIALNKHHHLALRLCIVTLLGIMIFFLTLTGIIDFFVIKNDTLGTLSDIPGNKIASWINTNTPKDAVFLNSSYLYHPASLAGRSVFLGWPYFAWSAGYKENRMPVMDTMYETRDPAVLCPLLRKYHITYITVEDVKNDTNLPDIDLQYFVATYTPVFLSDDKRYAIFTSDEFCP